MDKEILRIVIIATGLIIVVAMLTWGYLKDKKAQQELVFDDEIEPQKVDNRKNNPKTDEDYIVPIGSAIHPPESDEAYYQVDEDDEVEYEDHPQRIAVPEVIQFCLTAKAQEGFNGADLMRAFRIAGLKYGSLKIFERLDNNQLVDFGVACMAESGTFPSTDLDSFYCRGIVFFMQPAALDDALAVFDDYIETIRMLAVELDGDIWDHQRKPLTDATLQTLRLGL